MPLQPMHVQELQLLIPVLEGALGDDRGRQTAQDSARLVIDPAVSGLYSHLMGRLLILLAVLLMPLGMSAAPAAAHSVHSMTAADMPMQHCPDRGQKHSKAAFAECTMACSAALPAADLARNEPLIIATIPHALIMTERLHGLHPETATPPPKDS